MLQIKGKSMRKKGAPNKNKLGDRVGGLVGSWYRPINNIYCTTIYY